MGNLQIFTLPGLGFDHRIFSKMDFGGHSVRHLDWIAPLGDEPIQAYAKRLWGQEDLTGFQNSSNPRIALVGHSFGGMLAQEIAQFVDIERIVLVSSIKSRAEHPLHFTALAPLRLHRIFTKKLTISTFPFWAKSSGYVSEEDQALFMSMVAAQTNACLQWSLKTLSRWQAPPPTTTKIVHIHGTDDRNFPIRLLQQPFLEVKGGGHFMVFNRAGEVGRLLREVLE